MDIFLIAGSEWLWKEVNVQCLIHILLIRVAMEMLFTMGAK